jgi:O-6-methylguanine DNA methyltransferase
MTRLDQISSAGSAPDPASAAALEPDPGFAAIEAALSTLAEPAPARLGHAALVAVGLADDYAEIGSPLGTLRVAWNARGVSAVDGSRDDRAFEQAFLARTGRRAERVADLPPRLARAVERRLAGDRHARIDLDLRGSTDFEQAVWLKALEIPRGEVRPYGWIAAEIGRPRAVRAVGTALGHNPIPLIVPCHRVVRTDGFIGQYSLGGPANKRTILDVEGADPDGLEGLARAGVRYVGSDTTHIFCMPTCHDARRVTPVHTVRFRSSGEAFAAGYRPCRHCRPAVQSGAA